MCGLLAGAGCGSAANDALAAPRGPWVTSHSAHVTVHARPDDEFACPTQVDEVEADLEAIWDYFELPTSERSSVEWYRFRDAADWAAKSSGVCSDDEASGCERGGVLFAPLAEFEHELVHAALSGMGSPPPLFSEGVAVALTCSPREGELAAVSADGWAELLDTSTNQYGAELVVRLLQEYGPTRFRELYAALARDATPDVVATRFEQIYGVSLDDVWETTRSDPNRRYCTPWLACQSPAVRSADVELGPRCQSLRSAVRVPSDAGVSLVAQSGMALLRPCDAVSADYTSPPEGLIDAMDAETWFFPAGRDFAVQKWGDDASATFSVRPVEGAIGADCTAPRSTAVDALPWQRRLWMPPTDAQQVLAFQVAAPATVSWSSPTGSLLPGQDPWTIEACTSCDAGQLGNCTAYVSASVNDRVWLRVSWQPTDKLRTLRAELGFE
jgi:hypothetical protein